MQVVLKPIIFQSKNVRRIKVASGNLCGKIYVMNGKAIWRYVYENYNCMCWKDKRKVLEYGN